jgi:hypothetical protein
MIVKITAVYENGVEAVFTGEPVDLLSIPTDSPEPQSEERAE